MTFGFFVFIGRIYQTFGGMSIDFIFWSTDFGHKDADLPYNPYERPTEGIVAESESIGRVGRFFRFHSNTLSNIPWVVNIFNHFNLDKVANFRVSSN